MDLINHPPHYADHNGSQVTCIDIVEHLPFNVGNAIKYLWRHNQKNETLTDLQKARWYTQREIDRVNRGCDHQSAHLAARNAYVAWLRNEPHDRIRTQAIDRLFASVANPYADRLPILRIALNRIDAMIEQHTTPPERTP